jgi:hypothetical protein
MKKQMCVTLFALLSVFAMPLGAMESPTKPRIEWRNAKDFVARVSGADMLVNGNKKQRAVTGVSVGIGGYCAALGTLHAIQAITGRPPQGKKNELLTSLCSLAGALICMRLGAELSTHFLADDEDKAEGKQS